MVASIFFEFSLPNAATWFYFSFLLANAVFFKFDRLLSFRNLDVVSLYLLVPGLLLVQEAHSLQSQLPAEYRENQAGSRLAKLDRLPEVFEQSRQESRALLLAGYIWLVAGSGYFFGRCLLDLGMEKRPTLPPNLNLPGLIWLGAALVICLSAVAIRRLPDTPVQVGRGSVAIAKVTDGASAVVESTSNKHRSNAPFWVERIVAIGLHLSVIAALFLIGKRHFGDPTIGAGMACLYGLLPYTAYHASQIHHVWPAAFILWAIYSYRRPALAGAILGFAAGSAFFPLLLFPLWFGFYRGRGAGRFALGFLTVSALSLAATGTLLLFSGELREYLRWTMSLADWQAWKVPNAEGLWQGSHWAYRLPVFIAYMAFIVLTMFWPTPRNLAQVIAQTSAVIIGVQFWYADQGGVYVLWYLPFVLLMVFRPSLTDVRPPVPTPGFFRIPAFAIRLMARIRPRSVATHL
ncbi:MAG: hypothetical protein EXS09_21710 [Gemmataceae bacterium]|nr:hypothetical protein [Gemmataceae bacterium]